MEESGKEQNNFSVSEGEHESKEEVVKEVEVEVEEEESESEKESGSEKEEKDEESEEEEEEESGSEKEEKDEESEEGEEEESESEKEEEVEDESESEKEEEEEEEEEESGSEKEEEEESESEKEEEEEEEEEESGSEKEEIEVESEEEEEKTNEHEESIPKKENVDDNENPSEQPSTTGLKRPHSDFQQEPSEEGEPKEKKKKGSEPANDPLQNGLNFAKRSVIIQSLPTEMTESDLYDMVKKFGEVKVCKIAHSKSNGASLGIGYVRFKTKLSVLTATKVLNGFSKGKNILKVACEHDMLQEAEKENYAKVDVIGVHPYVKSSELYDLCSAYGKVEKVFIYRNQESEGQVVTCTVTFNNKTSAAQAILNLNGYKRPSISNDGLVLRVNRHDYPLFALLI